MINQMYIDTLRMVKGDVLDKAGASVNPYRQDSYYKIANLLQAEIDKTESLQ